MEENLGSEPLDKVNWPVFQAAAAVVGGAAAQSSRRLSAVIDEEFERTYHHLLAIAVLIQRQEVEDELERMRSDAYASPQT